MVERILTVKEVAEKLGVHPNTVRTMAEDGRLIGFKTKGDNGHWRFQQKDVDSFLDKGEEIPTLSSFEHIQFILDEVPDRLVKEDIAMTSVWNYIHRYYGIRSVFGSIAVHADKSVYHNLIQGKGFIWLGEGAANAMEAIQQGTDKTAKYISNDLKYGFAVVRYETIFHEMARSVVPVIIVRTKDEKTWVVDGTVQQFYPELPKGLAVMQLSDSSSVYENVIVYEDKKKFAEDYSDPNIVQRFLNKR